MAVKTTPSPKKRALAAARKSVGKTAAPAPADAKAPVERVIVAAPAAAEPIAEVVAPVALAAAVPPVADPSAECAAAMVQLRSYRGEERAAAAAELGRLGETFAVAPLIGALQDLDADVARDAATALGLLADPAAVEPLMAVVSNAHGYYHGVARAAAAASLGQLRDRRAVDALVELVGDWMAEASVEAIRALALLNDARAVRPLRSVVDDTTGFYAPIVRRAAEIAVLGLTAA